MVSEDIQKSIIVCKDAGPLVYFAIKWEAKKDKVQVYKLTKKNLHIEKILDRKLSEFRTQNPVLEVYKGKLILIIPNELTWIYDGNAALVGQKWPILRLIVGKFKCRQFEFKTILMKERLYVFMTSRRPMIDNGGQVWKPKLTKHMNVDNQRLGIRNSQIYALDLEALLRQEVGCEDPATFELLSLEIDNRARMHTSFIPIPHGPRKALLIGNDGLN